MRDILFMLDELEELMREEVLVDRTPVTGTLLILGELEGVMCDKMVGIVGTGTGPYRAVAVNGAVV